MKQLKRNIYDRKLAGICGGIGKALNIDSNLIRVIFLIAFGYFWLLLPIYLLCIFVIPTENVIY